ncbi:enoyl-CoA hydratase-related protein, partial [Pseudomonas chlororaphis]|uniref:enoyl-CoA hydratase-related protein n=1 Tax=Pseudomonas chlororaphis TaxID=587753 RepID=UPI0021821ED8
MPQTLAVESLDGGVRLITLQRPAALNALTTELLGELAAALDAAQADSQTRVVVLTGS